MRTSEASIKAHLAAVKRVLQGSPRLLFLCPAPGRVPQKSPGWDPRAPMAASPREGARPAAVYFYAANDPLSGRTLVSAWGRTCEGFRFCGFVHNPGFRLLNVFAVPVAIWH